MKTPYLDIQLSELLQNLPAGVVLHDLDSRIVYANSKALNLLRLSEEQAYGKDAIDASWNFIDCDFQSLAPKDYPVNRVLESGKRISEQVIGILDSSNSKPTWVVVNAYLDTSQDKHHVVVTFTDISQQYSLPFREIVDKATDAILICEADNLNAPDGPKIVYVNPMFSKLSGFSEQELMGNTPRILQGPETDRQALDRIRKALEKQEEVRETIINYTKNNEPYYLDISIFPIRQHGGDKVSHFAAIERDVTALKKAELVHINNASKDSLTDLFNRRGFAEIAETIIKRYSKDTSYSVLAVDIDFFKKVNDKYGHSVGDKVLKTLAKLFLASFRESDLCARFGGEEFIFLLPGINTKQANSVAERLREDVALQNFYVAGKSFSVTISGGISSGQGIEQLADVIEKADKGLYQAKELGRNRIVVMEK